MNDDKNILSVSVAISDFEDLARGPFASSYGRDRAFNREIEETMWRGLQEALRDKGHLTVSRNVEAACIEYRLQCAVLDVREYMRLRHYADAFLSMSGSRSRDTMVHDRLARVTSAAANLRELWLSANLPEDAIIGGFTFAPADSRGRA